MKKGMVLELVIPSIDIGLTGMLGSLPKIAPHTIQPPAYSGNTLADIAHLACDEKSDAYSGALQPTMEYINL